jgi:hypothetical protein
MAFSWLPLLDKKLLKQNKLSFDSDDWFVSFFVTMCLVNGIEEEGSTNVMVWARWRGIICF